jgi:DNA-binding CsgD family transcriptional regulator
LCVVALFQGQLNAACQYGEESVTLCRAENSPWDLALALFTFGTAIDTQGDHVTALALFEECHGLFRGLADPWGISVALGALGFVAGQNADYTTARAHFEEALAIRRTSADKWNIADSLNLLGEVVQHQGELEQANKLFAECLALDHEVGDKAHIALILHHLGVIAHLQNRAERAVRLLAVAASLRAKVSGAVFQTLTTITAYEEDILAVRTALGEEAFTTGWAHGKDMGLEQAIGYALAQVDVSEPAPPSVEPGAVLLSPPPYPAGLTTREVDVLRLLAQGLTYAQIAERLIISWRTVNAHLTSIYSKLGVNSRQEATHFAVKHHI